MSKIVILASFYPKNERESEVKKIIQAMVRPTRLEEGNEIYNFYEVKNDNDISDVVKYLYKELRSIGKQKIITKEFITKMYELSSRSVLKFFNYDTFLFKYAKSL